MSAGIPSQDGMEVEILLLYFIFLPPKWQAYILLYLLSKKFLLRQIWILHV